MSEPVPKAVPAVVAPVSASRGSLKADLVFNVGSQFVLRIVTAITALYAARVLGPEQFGVWAVLQVLFMYTAHGHFGIANAMMREVPLCQARGDQATAQRLVNSTWAFITLWGTVVTVIAGAVVLWFYRPATGHLALVALGSMWLVFVQLQSVFFQFYCRAYSAFKVMAGFSLTQSVVTFVLCFWLLPRLGISGYLFGLAAGFTLIPLAVVTRPGIRFEVSIPDWRRLLTIGLPMLPGTLMLYLSTTMDRLVLAWAVSSTAVGLFAAGAFFYQIGATVWELVIYTWYSRLAAIFGATGEIGALVAAMNEILPGAILVSSVLQGAAFIAMPFVLTHLLPAYTQSVDVARILILAMNLWGAGQFLSFALTIISKQNRAMMLHGILLALKLALILYAVFIWHSAVAVAMAGGLGLLTYVAMTWATWRKVSPKSLCAGHTVLFWFVPTIAAVGFGAGMEASPHFGQAVTRLALYLLAMASSCALVERKDRVITRLWAWRGVQ